MPRRPLPLLALLMALGPAVAPGADRKGDEIVVCGRYFPTGAPVVTWMDPGGYDAYNPDRRFPGDAKAGDPAKVKLGFGPRRAPRLPAEALARVQEDGWDLPTLQQAVDQFVIHYDVAGTSRNCFRTLHARRSLAVQFMLDLDGTIYQTLDCKEGAWHATKANGRSVGVEVANMGAVPLEEADAHFARWYKREGGRTLLTIPGDPATNGIRDKSLLLKPSRPDAVLGAIHGRLLEQYDLTEAQYDSLVKLTAALHRAFPKIKLDCPRGADGKVLARVLTKDEYDNYEGVLGHYHVQTNKTDPGPAFRWDRLIDGARALGVNP